MDKEERSIPKILRRSPGIDTPERCLCCGIREREYRALFLFAKQIAVGFVENLALDGVVIPALEDLIKAVGSSGQEEY